MKTLFAITIVLLFVLTTPVSAAGKLIITQEAFYVLPGFPYNDGAKYVIYAELKNTGNKPVMFNNGTIELLTDNGFAIEIGTINSCYPDVLDPGKVGYIFSTLVVTEVDDKSYIDDYMLSVTGTGAFINYTESLSCEGEYQEIKYYPNDEISFDAIRIDATIHNDTDSILFSDDIRIAVALYNSNDKLLYVDCITPKCNIAVPSGQSVIFYKSVENMIVDSWQKDGTRPARIKTIGYYSNQCDGYDEDK